MVKVLTSGGDGRSKVEFLFPGSAGARILLAGSFNDWDPELAVMTYDAARGGYTVTLELPPGEYEYKFVRGDEWLPDDGNPNFTANDFGTLNSVIRVD